MAEGRTKIKLNSAGIRRFLRSADVQGILKDCADDIKGRAGDGYESYVAKSRAVAVVETSDAKSYADNSKNNTLLKAARRGSR